MTRAPSMLTRTTEVERRVHTSLDELRATVVFLHVAFQARCEEEGTKSAAPRGGRASTRVEGREAAPWQASRAPTL